jgi:acetyl-CoA carboxylase carboxyl transferase alpha subunit/acetyl-CoA carboxylase carboxyl transferase beta subunit
MPQSKLLSPDLIHETIPPSQFFDRISFWFSRATARLGLRQAVLCPACGHRVTFALRYRRFRVCDYCGHNFPISAAVRIDLLVDPHSFSDFVIVRKSRAEFHRVYPIRRIAPPREAVVTGTARIAERPVVIVAFDFGFRGGTMSVAVGERITRAFEHASRHSLPVVAVIATGGVRIQEGMPALLQMAKTTQAIQEFQRAGRPFIAVLTHPTTGGVYASFANLADFLLAEPGALVGFAGPRVIEATTGEILPADSHHSESAYAHGMIDAIVEREDLLEVIARILSMTVACESAPSSVVSVGDRESGPTLRSGWETVMLARRSNRPTALDYVQNLFSDFTELHGDRLYGDDPAMVVGLARFDTQPIVVIAQERGQGDEHHRGSANPEGYRKAERLIRLAERFHLPIITLVDTPGADPGYDSERRGIARAIANCLSTLVQVEVPTVSIIIGEGTSGGALALAVTDRVLMLENATFSVISPEGASAILYGDAMHVAETADRLENRAPDLLRRGIVDRIVPEPVGGAHAQPEVAIANVKGELQTSLAQLITQDDAERLAARHARYRRMGQDTEPFSTN